MAEPGTRHGFAAGVAIESTRRAVTIIHRTRGPRRKPNERARQDDTDK
jgi:hypothetical protein